MCVCVCMGCNLYLTYFPPISFSMSQYCLFKQYIILYGLEIPSLLQTELLHICGIIFLGLSSVSVIDPFRWILLSLFNGISQWQSQIYCLQSKPRARSYCGAMTFFYFFPYISISLLNLYNATSLCQLALS